MNLAKLKEPFPLDCIEWKPGMMTKDKTKAMAMAYVDARAVQDRLDEVCGPENWQVEYTSINGGFLCKLTINCLPHSWVSKQDGAQETDFEALKGGISSALRRAGSAWGIGRYLYKLEPQWIPCETGSNGKFKKFTQTPKLPGWALPGGKDKTADKEITEDIALHDHWKAQIEQAQSIKALENVGHLIENKEQIDEPTKVKLRLAYNSKRNELKETS